MSVAGSASTSTAGPVVALLEETEELIGQIPRAAADVLRVLEEVSGDSADEVKQRTMAFVKLMADVRASLQVASERTPRPSPFFGADLDAAWLRFDIAEVQCRDAASDVGDLRALAERALAGLVAAEASGAPAAETQPASDGRVSASSVRRKRGVS